jgi:hypothetical protein
MSVEKILELVDNSSKDSDPVMYKFNLLLRTLKGNRMMMEFVTELSQFYVWIHGQPTAMQEQIWIPHFKSFLQGLAVSSSENGWLMDIATQVRVNYRGNTAEARKFSLLKGNQKADEQQQ